MATGEQHLWRQICPLRDLIKSSSQVLPRRLIPGRNQFHHQNRSKELCLEKNDSPICPSTDLTSEIFHCMRPFGNRARNYFHESQLLHLTSQANQSMTHGHFAHKVDDSRAVVAEFYQYLCYVDVDHNDQDRGIVIFHFPCHNIRSGAPAQGRPGFKKKGTQNFTNLHQITLETTEIDLYGTPIPDLRLGF